MSAHQIAIFDIDGTLTDTNVVDDECYIRAAAETFGLSDGQLDWSDAPHVTDVAIAQWLCERHLGRRPNADELDRMIALFVEMLILALATAPERFAPIAGARDLFAWLRDDGWDIALATGGWGPSARLKLRASGLDELALIPACASDAHTREEIVRLAHDRAAAAHERAYTRVVNIGDGVWDVRTSAVLRMPFIGIATGAKAERLRSVGAQVVLPNYVDLPAVATVLATASIHDRIAQWGQSKTSSIHCRREAKQRGCFASWRQ